MHPRTWTCSVAESKLESKVSSSLKQTLIEPRDNPWVRDALLPAGLGAIKLEKTQPYKRSGPVPDTLRTGRIWIITFPSLSPGTGTWEINSTH